MNKMTHADSVFLATTALEEYWDATQKIVFLSDACLRISRKSHWEDLDFSVFKSPLANKDELLKAYTVTDAIYEKFLPWCAQALNEIHDVHKEISYWRVVLGPWLMTYIQVLYERYTCIQSALSEYPNLQTLLLSPEVYYTPIDFGDFINCVTYDAYNLQLYSKIFAYLGKTFPEKSPSKQDTVAYDRFVHASSQGLKRRIKHILKQHAAVVVKASYFPPHAEKQLLLMLRGRVYFDHDRSFRLPRFKMQQQQREQLGNLLMKHGCGSEVERMLLSMIAFEMPVAYIEGFCYMTQRVSCEKKPRAIITSESWYFDELFKFWSAAAQEQGTRLYGIQHGGHYGCARMNRMEQHEIKISKRYYTWGWKPDNGIGNIEAFFSPRMMLHGRSGRSQIQKQHMLLVTNCMPRYSYGFQDYSNYDNRVYFEWQEQFYKSLPTCLQRQLFVRLYLVDYGCDTELRWKHIDPAIQFDNRSLKFHESIQRYQLCIHDHLANTYLETLVADMPTILFWDPRIFALRVDAVPYFELLRQARILFYSPEEAANHIESIYGHIQEWWGDVHLQKARREFCNRFARNDRNGVKHWGSEFRKIIAESKNNSLRNHVTAGT